MMEAEVKDRTRDIEKVEDVVLLALNMEKGTMGQGIQVNCKS